MAPARRSAASLKGIAISPGIAVGPVVYFQTATSQVPRRSVPVSRLDAEVQRLRDAFRRAEEDVRRKVDHLGTELNDNDKRIFATHLQLYQDEVFVRGIEERIRGGRLNAEAALQDEIDHVTQLLRGMDSLFREREADVRDVGKRVRRVLLDQAQASLQSGTEPFVLYARELLPTDTMELDRGRILAIVTERGGAASHVAILARAFEIPAVSGIRDLDQRVPPGTVIGVNGTRGEVTLHPTARQQTALSRAALAYREERQLLQARSTERARGETESGIRVLLNIENFEELPPEVLRTTAGIGLYRTEFLFMGRDQFPTEEEQYDFYRSVLRRVGPREVTFRTIDVGADKPLKYLTTPREQNPVLGWRGIRLTFQWPDLLIPQLRALLRATAHGAVRVMLPMVTTVEEVRQARKLVSQLAGDLRRDGHELPRLPPLGVMIEVPAAALACEDLADEADFLSVGTNDLGQYVFAVDRNNLQVASLYQPLHPAMLRLLKSIIDAAGAQGKDVSVCGEMAGQPLSVLALLGLGLRRFSMSPAHVPDARFVLDLFTPEEAAPMLEQLLKLRTESDVRRVLHQAIEERAEKSGGLLLPWGS